MSLSQDRPQNPAKFRMEIKNGVVRYYDRDLQDNVNVDVPFEFIVLDRLATVGGWSDADNSGYWSNEVRAVSKEPLTVRTSKGIKESGLWAEIKGKPSVAGAKYVQKVYIAHQSEEGMVISSLMLTGSSLNTWIEFMRNAKLGQNKVILSDWSDDKKGAVKFKRPVFSVAAMTPEERAEAVELDKQLQSYLNGYFSRDNESSDQPTTRDQVIDDDVDVEEPIDLDEIPF